METIKKSSIKGSKQSERPTETDNCPPNLQKLYDYIKQKQNLDTLLKCAMVKDLPNPVHSKGKIDLQKIYGKQTLK
jgi:1,2-phenylacetyl-CoA epoxidase PaaB subunit